MISEHLKRLRRQIAFTDGQIFAAMKPYEEEWRLLQIIPGFDALSAALLISEVGVDMSRFGASERLCSGRGCVRATRKAPAKGRPAKPGRATAT